MTGPLRRNLMLTILFCLFGVIGCDEDSANCGGIDGEYTLGPAWMFIRGNEEQGCIASVAVSGHPAVLYSVTLTDTSAVLIPQSYQAISGWEKAISSYDEYWEKIVLDKSENELLNWGVADVSVCYWQEDIINCEEKEPRDLLIGEASAGKVFTKDVVLPWQRASIMASQPVKNLESFLSLPSVEWNMEDVVVGSENGIVESKVSFHGSWDDVRGHDITFDIKEGLENLAGTLIEQTDVNVKYLDIGPAIFEHKFLEMDTFATWGEVRTSEEGGATLEGPCGEWSGVAGQLDTIGKKEMIIEFSGPGPLFELDIEVVTVSGVPLERVDNAGFVYDVSGEDKVGFSIQMSSWCHWPAGPGHVEAVYAR